MVGSVGVTFTWQCFVSKGPLPPLDVDAFSLVLMLYGVRFLAFLSQK